MRLRTIALPSGLESIGDSAFYNCYSLANLSIPASVESIASKAFSGCKGLGYIKFEPSVPPALGGADVFTDVPTDCKILVPEGTLSAYTSAENYPSSSTYTYEEY